MNDRQYCLRMILLRSHETSGRDVAGERRRNFVAS
jgi:hypothetical protein